MMIRGLAVAAGMMAGSASAFCLAHRNGAEQTGSIVAFGPGAADDSTCAFRHAEAAQVFLGARRGQTGGVEKLCDVRPVAVARRPNCGGAHGVAHNAAVSCDSLSSSVRYAACRSCST